MTPLPGFETVVVKEGRWPRTQTGGGRIPPRTPPKPIPPEEPDDDYPQRPSPPLRFPTHIFRCLKPHSMEGTGHPDFVAVREDDVDIACPACQGRRVVQVD